MSKIRHSDSEPSIASSSGSRVTLYDSNTESTKSSSEYASITPFLLYVVSIMAIGAAQSGYHNVELNSLKNAFTHCVSDHDITIDGKKIPSCLSMTDNQFGFATSIFTLGGFLGSVCAAIIADKLGRIKGTLVNNMFIIFGSLCMCFATTHQLIWIGRFFIGLGCGIAIVIVPMYLAEVAPVRNRGLIGIMNQIGTVIGILLAQVLGFLLQGPHGWRVVLSLGCFLGIIQSVLLCFSVESPRFLVSSGGSFVSARSSLRRLRGGIDIEEEFSTYSITSNRANNSLLDNEEGDARSDISEETIDSSMEGTSISVIDLIRNPTYRKSLHVVVLCHLIQQFSGINAVFYFSTAIISKYYPTQAELFTLLIGILNVVVTFMAASVIDAVGRRPIFLSSMIGMGFSVIALGISILLEKNIFVIISMFFVVLTFGFGLGPIPFLITAELFDTKAVATASSFSISINWTSNFILSSIFLQLITLIGGYIFFIFAVNLLIATIIAYYIFPETKGLSIEEILNEQ